jgi:two-component system sensor histidine kinase ChiS
MKKHFLGVAILMLFSFYANAKNNTIINNGILDLSNHSWQKDGVADLTGEWEFYWKQFYSPSFFKDSAAYTRSYAYVPSFWNSSIPSLKNFKPAFGYATYRVVIKCPSSPQQLALKFLTVESAYTLFVNGKEIITVGQPSTTSSQASPELRPVIVNVTPENDTLDIVIHVSNFNNRVGGLWDFIKLGTRDQLQSRLIDNISLELFIAGAFFLAAIYYLILYIRFKTRYALLFFSLLCLIIFIRSLVTGDMPILYITNWSWQTARRLEYVSLFLAVPFMSLFSYHLFPQEFNKKIWYVVLSVCGLFLLLSLLGSYYQYTYVVLYYELIIVLMTFYGLYVYIKAAINKRRGSILFLIGFCIFIVTIINDLLYVNLVIETVPLFYIGLAIFVIMLSIMLSGQFYETFQELQVANAKLSEKNNKLGEMNDEISEKNKELKKMNIELDSFVNRTSHDLRAPLTSVLGINKLVREENNSVDFEQYLSMQEKTLIRMDSLISDIIDFSKNKRLDLQLKEIDFSEMVADAIDDHSFMLNAPAIEKKVNIEQFEKFISDPSRVSIILNNLISNAIKYADTAKAKPELCVNVKVVDNMATIEVSDNGIGIEEQHLDKIFTLFYRVTNSTSGTGLGLYIIKETVDKLSGYIIINSHKNDGTNIKVILPNMGYKL